MAVTVVAGPVTNATGATTPMVVVVGLDVVAEDVPDDEPPLLELATVVVVDDVVVVGAIVVDGAIVDVVVVVVVGVALASVVMPRCTAFRADTRNSYAVPELSPDTVNEVLVFTPSFAVVQVDDEVARYCTT